jgi:DNA-binding MarR family transcriptional regulator
MAFSTDNHMRKGRPKVLTLSTDDVDAATRVLSLLVDPLTAEVLINNDGPNTLADEERNGIDRQSMTRTARKMLVERMRRIEIFGKEIFKEPAWDMLLILYVNESFGTRQTVSRLIENSGASFTTGLRWMKYLTNKGLIERSGHPNDKRKAFLKLTDTGRMALEKYLAGAIVG